MKIPSTLIRQIEKAAALSPLFATAWLALTPVPAHAAVTDIAPAPLANSSQAVVKPNILMILDDSGSMDSAHMPDEVTDNYCKRGANATTTLTGCQSGDVAYNATEFNGLYYNPAVTYAPAVNADLTSKTSYNTAALWAAVPNDAYNVQFTGTIDLTNSYPDQVFCSSGSSSSDRQPPYLSGVCKHPLPFTGTTAQKTTWTYPDGTYSSRQSVSNNTTDNIVRAPHYYSIAGVTWCQNRNNLGFGSSSCQAKRTSSYQYPMYGAITRTDIVANEVTTPYTVTAITQSICGEGLADTCSCSGSGTRRRIKESTTTATRTIVTRGARVVSDSTGATSAPVVTFPSATCVDIGTTTLTLQNPNPSITITAGTQTTTALSYPKTTTRTDCTGAVGGTGCSFTEEMTNFANWYSYYRTRMQMMKTASGLAFKTLNQNYRVGFMTINPSCNNTSGATCPGSGGVKSSKFLAIAPFEGLQRQTWYDKFYAILPVPSTPLREALAVAGRYFAGKGPVDTAAAKGINRGMDHDPIEYSCQQNFAILSTDGLWNTGDESVGPVAIDATTLVGNPDSNPASAPRPLLDGSNEQTTTNTTTTTLTQAICTGNAGVLGTTCGCPANLKRVIQQTVASTDTVITKGGVQQGGTTNTTNTTYQTIFPVTAGVCDALQVGTQTPQTTTETKWCKDGTTPGNQATFSDGQTNSCSGCSSGAGFLVKQTNQRTKTDVSYDGGATVSTITVNSTNYEYFSNNSWVTSKPTSSGSTSSRCTTSNLSGSAVALAVTNGTPVVPINTGATVTSANFTLGTPAGPGPMSTTTSSSVTTSGTPNTLADVAQYYYITDLRGGTDAFGNATGPSTSPSTPTTPGGDVSENNVKGQTSTDVQNDSAIWQHMTTFTVGLGVDGTLTYASDYRNNPTGDFLLIKNGASNWPTPAANTITTVDDLWHTGVNGRGKYLSARDPSQLAGGLQEALSSVNAVVGAAAAAATSNLEPVAGDNFAYIASYETVRWNGEVEARTIDLNTGAVSSTNSWSAQTQLDTLANSTTPGGNARKIWRLSPGAAAITDTGGGLQAFTYANLDSTTEQIYFQASHVSGGSGASFPALTQWATLDPTTQRPLVVGDNLVNFIRGDGSHEDNSSVTAVNRVFRDRAHVLGDIVNAQPVFVKKVPDSINYTDANFATFKTCINSGGTAGSCTTVTGTDVARPATVYISANDGMLHALNGDTGAERWAYVPNMLLPKLYKLADSDYKTAINHQWLVDGSPSVGDVYDSSASKWKTVLVGGLNGGQRGYYALDVTDPLKPKGLWEFKVRTSGSCTSAAGDTDDCDLGYSYGNPILTKLGNGTWVVMLPSGYNNVNPGDGKGYLYVLNPITGALIKKVALCSAAPQSPSICPGDTVTPMGFAKINNWVDDSSVNNTTLRVYGGDLLGNLWRIDADNDKAYVIAQLKDGATPTSTGQPVTTKPELGQVTGSGGTADMVYVATGKYLGASDTSTTQKQTVYAIKDATNGTAPVTPIDARGGTVTAQTLTDTTDATGAAVRTVTNTPVSVTTAGVDGWKVDLPVSGERVNVDMKLQLGTLIVGSNVPASNSCNSGGFSFLNFFDYRTGSYIPSAGSNIAGQRVGNSLLVGINVVRLPNNKTVAIATTSDNQHPTLYPPFQSPNPVGRRVGWRELNE